MLKGKILWFDQVQGIGMVLGEDRETYQLHYSSLPEIRGRQGVFDAGFWLDAGIEVQEGIGVEFTIYNDSVLNIRRYL